MNDGSIAVRHTASRLSKSHENLGLVRQASFDPNTPPGSRAAGESTETIRYLSPSPAGPFPNRGSVSRSSLMRRSDVGYSTPWIVVLYAHSLRRAALGESARFRSQADWAEARSGRVVVRKT